MTSTTTTHPGVPAGAAVEPAPADATETRVRPRGAGLFYLVEPWLYRVDLAKPKRTATPAQLRAVRAALRARRICSTCRVERSYYIPRSLGECLDCAPWRG